MTILTRLKRPLCALLLLLSGFASPGFAHDAMEAPPTATELVRVTMKTEMGDIVLDLDKTNAPVTTANFLRYVDDKRFDGIVFYRVMRLEWGTPPNGLIQAGVQGDPKRVLKPIAHEPTSQTGLRHLAGTISMARFAPGTATGDFSILVSPQPGLDAAPESPSEEAQAGFAAFGQVVEGMDVVRAIYDVPLSPTKGEGFLKGQMIERPVKILSVRRSPAPPRQAPALDAVPVPGPAIP